MKKLRISFLKKMNLLFASLIAALGMSGCKQQKAIVQTAPSDDAAQPAQEARPIEKPVVCMYGVPRAGYQVEGVVQDADGVPQQRKVLISTREDLSDALEAETDESGRFSTHFDGFPADSLYFKVEGVEVSEPVKYGEAKNAFDRGETNTQVIITIPTAGPGKILVKYGVPPRNR